MNCVDEPFEADGTPVAFIKGKLGTMWWRPNPRLNVQDVRKYALTVNGYAFADTVGIDLPSLANERRTIFDRSGEWVGLFEELRCCLFYEQRRWRFCGEDSDIDDQAFLALNQALCLAWDREWPVVKCDLMGRFGMRVCLCGCGGNPKTGRYLPGHDGKRDSTARKYARKYSLVELDRRLADPALSDSERAIWHRAKVFALRPKNVAKFSRVAPFTAISGIGQAYDLAVQGTTTDRLMQLCRQEGIAYSRVLYYLKRGRSQNYTWKWIELGGGLVRIEQNP